MREIKFQENLRTLRKIRGYTQETLAEKCDYSRQTISNWENNGKIYLDELVKLAEIFDITLDDLVFNDPLNGNRKKEVSLEEKLENLLSYLNNNKNVLTRYNEQRNIDTETINTEAFYISASDALDEDDYDKAIFFYEKALFYGDVFALSQLDKIYDMLMEGYLTINRKDLFEECKREYNQKKIDYEKIILKELQKKYPDYV